TRAVLVGAQVVGIGLARYVVRSSSGATPSTVLAKGVDRVAGGRRWERTGALSLCSQRRSSAERSPPVVASQPSAPKPYPSGCTTSYLRSLTVSTRRGRASRLPKSTSSRRPAHWVERPRPRPAHCATKTLGAALDERPRPEERAQPLGRDELH